MTTTTEQFKAFFPEFCDVPDSVVTVWLDEATSYLDPASWGDCFDRACRYWTAHNLSQSQSRVASPQQQSGSGAITSASAGGLSVSYAIPDFAVNGTADEIDYSKTEYGVKYLALRDNCLGAGQLCGTIAIDPVVDL